MAYGAAFIDVDDDIAAELDRLSLGVELEENAFRAGSVDDPEPGVAVLLHARSWEDLPDALAELRDQVEVEA